MSIRAPQLDEDEHAGLEIFLILEEEGDLQCQWGGEKITRACLFDLIRHTPSPLWGLHQEYLSTLRAFYCNICGKRVGSQPIGNKIKRKRVFLNHCQVDGETIGYSTDEIVEIFLLMEMPTERLAYLESIEHSISELIRCLDGWRHVLDEVLAGHFLWTVLGDPNLCAEDIRGKTSRFDQMLRCLQQQSYLVDPVTTIHPGPMPTSYPNRDVTYLPGLNPTIVGMQQHAMVEAINDPYMVANYHLDMHRGGMTRGLLNALSLEPTSASSSSESKGKGHRGPHSGGGQ